MERNKYSNNITATLCYVRDKDNVLMLHRTKKENDIHKGKYNGLGGKLEKGETPYECVIREVYEESGLMIKKPVLKGILNFPDFDCKNNWIVFVYVANDFSGKIKESDEGDLVWVKKNRITELPLWEGDKVFLKYIFTEKFFYGTFYYHQNKLKKYKFNIVKI